MKYFPSSFKTIHFDSPAELESIRLEPTCNCDVEAASGCISRCISGGVGHRGDPGGEAPATGKVAIAGCGRRTLEDDVDITRVVGEGWRGPVNGFLVRGGIDWYHGIGRATADSRRFGI